MSEKIIINAELHIGCVADSFLLMDVADSIPIMTKHE